MCSLANASQVQVLDCGFVTTKFPIPIDSLTGDFIIRRHITETEPFETLENELWAQGKFQDNGYFEVTVFPLEGDPVTARSTSVRTTLLNSDETVGDSYLDEAVTMEKTFEFEGYTLDSVSIIFKKADGTAIDSHLEVPPELDRNAWDPWPGCGFGFCPTECKISWHVPGEPQPCGTPGNPQKVCSTGSYLGRVRSVTFEPHEEDHGTVSGFRMNAGLNDAWVNQDAPFQGLFVTVYENLGLVFLSWFSFDSELPSEPVPATFGAGDQRWVTALGSIEGNHSQMNAELTFGGLFNSSDPTPTQDTDYGTIEIEFDNCSTGTVTFNFPASGKSGTFSISRALDSNVALCEAMAEG